MEIKTQAEGKVTIVEIAGSLDGNTSPAAQEKILPLIVPDCRLVFDMSKCDYISSAGLRLLLVIAKQLAKSAGRGAFASLADETKDVMQMTGFDNIFKNYGTAAEAIISVSEDK